MRNSVSSRASNLDAQVDRHDIAEDFHRKRQLVRTRVNGGQLLAYINWNLTTSSDTSQGVLCDRLGNSLNVVVPINAVQSIICCAPQAFGYALYVIECCGVNSSGAPVYATVSLSKIPPAAGLGTSLSVTALDSSSRLLHAGSLITNVVGGSTLNNILPVAFPSGGSTDPSTYTLNCPLSYAATTSIPFPASISPPQAGAVFKASGTNHAAGIVPDPGAVAGTTKYLREDATFDVPYAVFGGVGVGHSSGLVPDPGSTAGHTPRFLREDSTWNEPGTLFATFGTNTASGSIGAANTVYAITPNSGSLIQGALTGWSPGSATLTCPFVGLYLCQASLYLTSGGFAPGAGGSVSFSAAFTGPASSFSQVMTLSPGVTPTLNNNCLNLSALIWCVTVGNTIVLSTTVEVTGTLGTPGSATVTLQAVSFALFNPL